MDQQDDLALKTKPPTGYDADVVAWAYEQAALLRAGRWAELDIEHLADEIEDVARSEKRELASRMAVLLSHLLKWQLQPERRGASWQKTIRVQRKGVVRRIEDTPSLAPLLNDAEWLDEVWDDAKRAFERETGLADHPDTSPWSVTEILTEDWLPPEP